MLEKAILRFHEFEIDPATRTLRAGLQTVALTPRTFDLLLYMAEHPRQVLTKDHLLNAVWQGAFVEESNLSQHVFLLRKALTSAGLKDRVVVTVPGKGYQFTAPVEVVDGPSAPLPANSASNDLVLHAVESVTRVIVEEETEDGQPEPAAPKMRKAALGWIITASAFAVASIGAAIGWYQMRSAPARPVQVVLADLENETGDADFDPSLNHAFAIELEQSPFLNLVPYAAIKETLAQMQLPTSQPLTPELAREVCERNNAQVVLDETISRLGNRYLLMVNATNCATDRGIGGYEQAFTEKSDVLHALDAAANHLRKQLGESADSLVKFQTPIAEATTRSLDALRAYTQALDSADHGDTVSEQQLYERAIALDNNFASAYKGLAIHYYNRQDFPRAHDLMQKAYDLRMNTTERERLAIEIAYNNYGIGDYEAAIASMKLFNQVYPGSAENWYSLCNLYSALGEYQQAIEAGQQGYRIDPHSGVGLEMLVRAYRRANQYADAKRLAKEAIAQGKDRWGLHSTLFQIAYVENDQETMKAESEWGEQHQHAALALVNLGFVAASIGKRREAIDLFTRARQEAVRSGDNDFADISSMFLAAILFEWEDVSGAAARLKEIGNKSGDPGNIAFFQAEVGDTAAAQRELERIASSGTKNTLSLYFDEPMLRALLALKANRPKDAVEAIEPARKYQMRDYGVPYQRARMETAAGLYDQAADDYRLILANEGIDPIWPDYVLSHLRLARVLALQHKTADARAEYQAFLGIWKDADPDLPLYQEAKNELARLP